MNGSGGFLGRALASRESAYFLNQSKNAVGNLITKSNNNDGTSQIQKKKKNPSADVLPEVLQHSVSLTPPTFSSTYSFSSASKWSLRSNPHTTSSDSIINPLRDYVALPQVTFGPRRWAVPEAHHSVLPSTANQLRADNLGYTTHVNPQKLKAAAEGLAVVGKAFAIATLLVFGGATFAFALAVSKLQLQTTEDIRAKGQNILQPKIEMFKEKMVPLRYQAELISRKWHIDRDDEIKEKPIIKELSKILGGGALK